MGLFADGRRIMGHEFKPAHEIIDISIDTARQEVVMVLMKKQDGWDRMAERVMLQQALFDIKTNSFRWAKDFPIHQPCSYVFSKKRFMRVGAGKTTCYDKADGRQLWAANVPVVVTDDDANVAISPGGTAYDLNTGAKRWYRGFRPEQWKTYTYVNDTTMVVVSDALHYIRITDGEGWDFAGEKVRGFSEFARYSSNVLIENNKIYFATTANMYCLDTSGRIVWKQRLPEKTGSVSYIDFNAQYIVMTNYGSSWTGGKTGAAFLAAWHKENGQQKYLQMVEPKDKIIDLYGNATSNVMICSKHVYRYNVYTGEKIIDVKIKGTPFENYYYLLHPYTCLVRDDDGKFLNIWEKYEDDSFWMNPQDESILRVDHRMRPIDTIAAENWWGLYKRKPEYYLVRKNGKSVMVRDGTKFADLYIKSAVEVGDKLVNIEKDRIRIIDLKGWF